MIELKLERLTPRQREAWRLRYHRGWRIRQIARKLGRKCHSISELLMRAERKLGLPKRKRLRIHDPKPKLIRPISLSRVRQY